MAKIEKIYDKNFTRISNELIRNDSLSWKARGIFAYLWSMPDDWDFYETEVEKHAPEGRAALRSGLTELEKYGFLLRVRNRDSQGRLTTTSWKIADKPVFTPMFDFPMLDKPMLDNRTLLTTNNTNYLSNQNNEHSDECTKFKTDKKENKNIDEDFKKLWKLYPNKKGRQKALNAYKKAIKDGVTNKQIQNGILSYIQEIKAKNLESKFIKHGSTWFIGKGWDDEYDDPKEKKTLDYQRQQEELRKAYEQQ